MLKDNLLDNAHANNILLPCIGERFMTIAYRQLLPRRAAEQTKKISIKQYNIYKTYLLMYDINLEVAPPTYHLSPWYNVWSHSKRC